MAEKPPKVSIDANRTRLTKVAGGDWDDRTQKVQIEVIVKNLDLNKPVGGLKLHYWVLAQSLVDRKAFLVIDKGSFPVKLDCSQEGREIRHKGETLNLHWDDTGSVFGERYKGYVLVLLNGKKEVVAVKANQPSWQKNFERAFKLKKGSWCEIDLEPTGAP